MTAARQSQGSTPALGARALLLLSLCAPLAATTLAAAGALAVLRWRKVARPSALSPLARDAARIVAAARHTHYQHDPDIDPTTGTYDLDCAAFLSLVLEDVAPATFAQIPRAVGRAYPQAFELYDYLAAPQVGWTLVPDLAEAEPGDVIAWRLPPSPSGDTGHVMVVATPPTFEASHDAWAVPVYDASDVEHFEDGRFSGGIYRDGVGLGTVRLAVDACGRPTAFQFGPGAVFHALPILIARLAPAAQLDIA